MGVVGWFEVLGWSGGEMVWVSGGWVVWRWCWGAMAVWWSGGSVMVW